MKRFLAGLVVGVLLVGASVASGSSLARTLFAGPGDVIKIDLGRRQIACLVGEAQERSIYCGRLDGRGYSVYLNSDGSAAIRRGNTNKMICIFPEVYCRASK